MAPFADAQPRTRWENCKAKDCKQLFEGQLWKCSPLTYLRLQDTKYGLSEAWAPYLQYQPLPPDCTDEALRLFLAHEDEAYCGMCPARPEPCEKPLPFASAGGAGPLT
ncbi:MAG: hypothetical protein H7338_17110 [Candidatus Sericytochromatia bacterium]|nr:hypothetical protein [Candidatus Sericytochromatia bacterium]